MRPRRPGQEPAPADAPEPRFGEADLTNCERELIHLPGSIQPHGVLLAFDTRGTITRASRNCADLLGRPADALLGTPLRDLLPGLASHLEALETEDASDEPRPLRIRAATAGDAVLDGAVHRSPGGEGVLELMPTRAGPGEPALVTWDEGPLLTRVKGAIERFGRASNLTMLCDEAARTYRDMTGYDRVMIYRFDPDGHGQIIAEARDPRLSPLLGHRYPASDIPQRARQLYLANRVRVLVDVDYTPSPVLPQRLPGSNVELDMSMCYLRSMSPLHLQYLRNMGVTATLVVSIVHKGRLWGLVAAHHYSPRNLAFPVRAASALIAEAMATRIVAIENYAHARVAIQVRRLEQRLIEATSAEGDWRYALFRNPQTLLRPLEASGAVLFHDDAIMTAGDVPSTPELRALQDWLAGQADDGVLETNAVGQDNPALASLTPLASGVLAVRLSMNRPEFIVWLRKEQLETVTWAGDPNKPMLGNDPLELSPRRSFEIWSEIVRGKAQSWTSSELSMARAIGDALVDIITQVHAVRLLIAEHHLREIRGAINASREPVIVFDRGGRRLFHNDRFAMLLGVAAEPIETLDALLSRVRGDAAPAMRTALENDSRWLGELTLSPSGGPPAPVRLRADHVPGPHGGSLGLVISIVDLTRDKQAAAARAHLEQTLSTMPTESGSGGAADRPGHDDLLDAIITNASLAAMDIADALTDDETGPSFRDVEDSTLRASRLHRWIRSSYRS